MAKLKKNNDVIIDFSATCDVVSRKNSNFVSNNAI